MAAPYRSLVAALAVLAADATIELGFVTSMVSYLHSGAPSGVFTVNTPSGVSSVSGSTYQISGKPAHFLLDQGHTSNGAAGTALILVGAVGTLALFGRWYFRADYAVSYAADNTHRRPTLLASLARLIYWLWLILQIPALLLTLGALAYVFSVTHQHSGQTIDQAVAAQIRNAAATHYPLDSWTPQNWYSAVLEQLDLTDPNLRDDLSMHLRIMRGWQYNLIPLFLLQLVETVLAFVDFLRWRRGERHLEKEQPRSSYNSYGDNAAYNNNFSNNAYNNNGYDNNQTNDYNNNHNGNGYHNGYNNAYNNGYNNDGYNAAQQAYPPKPVA